MLLICHPTCSTCDKARKFLEAKGLEYEERDIRLERPSLEELKAWQAASGLPLKRFFNTSGIKYRELELTRKLPEMGMEEQFRVLASDGMLVKRPILLARGRVLVGFDPKAWELALSQSS